MPSFLQSINPFNPSNTFNPFIKTSAAYSQPQPQVQGAQTSQQPFIGPLPVQGPVYQGPAPIAKTFTPSGQSAAPAQPAPQQQAPSYAPDTSGLMAAIESGYNDALSQANTAETGLRGQAAQATSEINTQAGATRASLESQRATGEEGLRQQGETAYRQANTGLQGARDLFRQTQQQNIAQLSALGLSSSSVSEALAEKLGVEMARRVAGVTGSRDEVLQNISKEKARVNDFAAQKKTELEQNLQNQISSIQQQLLQGVRQIQDSRQMAATAKASQRAELLSQAQQQIYQIQSNAQNFAQQLAMWQQQKGQVLTDAEKGFTIAPTDTTGLQTALGQAVSPMAPQGFGWNPTVDTAPSGYKRVGVNLVPKKEDISNPFATQQ